MNKKGERRSRNIKTTNGLWRGLFFIIVTEKPPAFAAGKWERRSKNNNRNFTYCRHIIINAYDKKKEEYFE